MNEIAVGTGPLGYVIGEHLSPDVEPQQTATPAMTRQQIKDQFRARGESVGHWADKNGFPRDLVYRVLNGRSPAWRGKCHQVAVALGIKPNVNQPTK